MAKISYRTIIKNRTLLEFDKNEKEKPRKINQNMPRK